ncbi:MAG: peptide deformylase [Candidatus Omnitrophica bacterium]|nr:peptide deformylase [Candidatus Omnitrophota bacterium]MDD5672374.1 peptide deformylase [Candidatus Omnitrophota bacterium]
MTLLKIKIYPDPVLHQKAERLTSFGPEEQKLFDDMIETMYREDGVGLAAPQVGISKRFFVACPTQKRGEEIVVVNPQILESKGRENGTEGCLSLPGIQGEVARAKRVRLRFETRHGEKKEAEVKDFFARVFQHEIDHLDGILLIDRVDFAQRQAILGQYQSL